jgi:two-component system response regulator FlrC
MACPNAPLSKAALARLSAHGWRGNVRELENTLHRAVLLADGNEIGPEVIDLPDTKTTSIPHAIPGLVGRSMEDVERQLILETLSHTLGNRTHAAVILGISIRALRNKLRDYTHSGVHVPPPHMAGSADSEAA